MNNIIKYSGIIGGAALAAHFSKKLYKYFKKSYEDIKQDKIAKENERQEKINKFIKCKNNFKKIASDSKISSVTLQNDKIKSVEDRSYLYDKLNYYKNKALDCSYLDGKDYEYYVDLYANLWNALKELDDLAISAKIMSLKNDDTIKKEQIERNRKASEEALIHRREMEKIEAEKDAKIDIYKAKLKAEESKLKTICETMSGDNKSVNNTLNIKTNVSED